MALTMSDMAGEPETGDLLLVLQQRWGGTTAKWKENGDMIRNIEIVWGRIRAHGGEVFHQIRGKAFYYQVMNGYLRLSTTNQNIPQSDFEKALAFVPLENTVPVQHLRGPSYIYAILMDKRIRQDDW